MKFTKILLTAVMASTLVACGSSSSSSEGVSGTYTGTAKGMGGDVEVKITLTDSVITNVEVEGEDETEGIGTKAIEELPDEMVKENSIAVDGVSGATVTSDAIKEAAEAAITFAGLDASDYQ